MSKKENKIINCPICNHRVFDIENEYIVHKCNVCKHIFKISLKSLFLKREKKKESYKNRGEGSNITAQ